MRDVLAQGLTFAGSTGGWWTCQADGREVACVTDADVDPGAAAPPLRIDVAVAPSTAGSVTNKATVTTPGEHEWANNVAETATAVADPPPGSPPPPVGGDDTPPRPRATSLRLRRLAKRPPLSRLLRGGLRVSGRCTGGTSGKVSLVVGAKQARRARVPKRTLATARFRCRSGAFTVRLRAKGKLRRALTRLGRALPATVIAELSGPSGRSRDRAEITLRAR